MPTSTYWGEPSKSYLVFELTPPWTWTNFEETAGKALLLIKELAVSVPVLLNGLAVKSVAQVPPGPAAQHYVGALLTFAPYVSHFVLAGGSIHGTALITALNANNSRLKDRITIVASMPDAMAEIRRLLGRANLHLHKEPGASTEPMS